jgi:phytoene dehydrogenase-like protein
MSSQLDAVVVGAGPNGLAAAVALAQAGLRTRVIEAHAEIGGGTRTAELTLPGFHHDVCSAVHPLGELSPYLSTLPLAEHGLRWAHPELSVAHPLDDGSCVVLGRSVAETARGLGKDARAYERLMNPFVRVGPALMADLLGPLRIPRHPFAMARFGFYGVRPARMLARGVFAEERARALFAGCAAHAILPFDKLLTGAVGLLFAFTGHLCDWPMAHGGSRAISDALASYFRSLGGEITTGTEVRALR